MSRLGISNTTRVIAYDERGGIYAARLWWIMNHYGHSNVALLDGGWVKWAAEQRATNGHGPAAGGRNVRGESRDRQSGDGGSGKGGDQQPEGEADRCADPGRNRRQGSPQHQARRLHRIVDPRVLGGHARRRQQGVQAGHRHREALSRQGHHLERRGDRVLPGRACERRTTCSRSPSSATTSPSSPTTTGRGRNGGIGRIRP